MKAASKEGCFFSIETIKKILIGLNYLDIKLEVDNESYQYR